MSQNRMERLATAEAGTQAVLQGNLAFAVGCARAGIHVADGYPGTPSTEVIDKGLRFLQRQMRVGWSVNEANATALGFGVTMTGADAVVTMKVPGLFQAADVVATVAQFTAPRGALLLYIASDFVPSSTQYVADPRYFLKTCGIPILEPRTHQEMMEIPASAVDIGRRFATPVAVLANGLLCHSEGVVRLPPARMMPPMDVGRDFTRFMNLPEIARRNYNCVCSDRLPGVRALAEDSPLNRIEWNDRSLGVIVHGLTEAFVREVWSELPVKPSILSFGWTYPIPRALAARFAEGIRGRMVVLSDGLRFVQEELLSQGIVVEGKGEFDSRTEWSPADVAIRLGASPRATAGPLPLAPVPRPPSICAGCAYRAFGLVVERLRKRKKITASFGDIGCNTLLYFLQAIDTCACMGAADTQRQGAVLADPSLAGRAISVIGDSTECHTGLDATRNAVFRNIPGVKVVLDNRITAMTGGQPAPTSPENLAGDPTRFNLDAALAGEGARVEVVDGFDMRGIDKALRGALKRADQGEFTVLVVRGPCMQQVPAAKKRPTLQVVKELCTLCDQCFVCPGVERDDDGYPRFTHLCTGCGEQNPVCLQRCARKAIRSLDATTSTAVSAPRPPPPLGAGFAEMLPSPTASSGLPPSIRIAVRGVGGQGNLFLGKVLAEVALRSGFEKILKGETHGMAQLGGAVLSTFACGDVHSSVLAPGSADVLVALEMAEVLRPGFLELGKPDGVVLLNQLRIIPPTVKERDYPSPEEVRRTLDTRHVVEFDGLAEARAMGDDTGRTVNVIALGVLSTVPPLVAIPPTVWHRAILDVTPGEMAQRANAAAFERGRGVWMHRTVAAADSPIAR